MPPQIQVLVFCSIVVVVSLFCFLADTNILQYVGSDKKQSDTSFLAYVSHMVANHSQSAADVVEEPTVHQKLGANNDALQQNYKRIQHTNTTMPNRKRTALNVTDTRDTHKSYVFYDGDHLGGLGNLMFKMATVQSVAMHSNKTPMTTKDTQLASIFDLDVASLHGNTNHSQAPLTIGEPAACKCDTTVIPRARNVTGNITLGGFFQCHQYFEPVCAEIRHGFTFKKHIADAAATFLREAKRQHEQSLQVTPLLIGVHVRRGDILNARFASLGYNTPNATYYKHAMTYFQQKFMNQSLLFIAVSNDVPWVEKNLTAKFPEFHINTVLAGHTAELGMAILSRCNHVIMSVGTFSWWSAWLANGVTIYYDLWPTAGSWLETQVTTKDYFPSHWVPMH